VQVANYTSNAKPTNVDGKHILVMVLMVVNLSRILF